MASSPILTLVTPTYNQARYVEQTIRSVLSQKETDVEYVIVNDGSTDGSEEIIEKFSNRARVVNQNNIGQSKTLNSAWKTSKSKYLAYLSSDDLLLPNAISKMIEMLEGDRSLICAFPNSNVINENGKIVRENVCRPFDHVDTVVSQECYIGPGAVFRRDVFEKVDGWREDLRLQPDRDFWIRISKFGNIGFYEESLALYRLHRQSTSIREMSDSVAQEYVLTLDRYFSDAPVAAAVARKDEAYGNAYLMLARNSLRDYRFRDARRYYAEACANYPAHASPKTKLRLAANFAAKHARLALNAFRN